MPKVSTLPDFLDLQDSDFLVIDRYRNALDAEGVPSEFGI